MSDGDYGISAGGGYAVFPPTPAPPAPGPPAPVSYNPGPAPGGSYSGQSASSPVPPPAPPPNIFADYPGPAVDQANQIVQQFLGLLGFPVGVNANTLALILLRVGLQANQQASFQQLFNNMADDVKWSHPWAEFGLDNATYHNRKDSYDAMFESLIGQTPYGSEVDLARIGSRTDLQELYRQAFQGNWSQSQLMAHLQQDASFAGLRDAQPWLMAGQGEQQVQQQFASLYGSAPVDTKALAGWFRFNQGAQQLNRAGREAIMVAAPQPSTSEAR